jgi:hypothetical protein
MSYKQNTLHAFRQNEASEPQQDRRGRCSINRRVSVIIY